MTARQFLERYPDGMVGETPVDISAFIAKHGLDAELPGIDPSKPAAPVVTNHFVDLSGDEDEL